MNVRIVNLVGNVVASIGGGSRLLLLGIVVVTLRLFLLDDLEESTLNESEMDVLVEVCDTCVRLFVGVLVVWAAAGVPSLIIRRISEAN